MPDYACRSVMGPSYDFSHDDILFLGTYSGAIYSWDSASVWVHSCTAHSCLATVQEVFGTKFEEELHLGDGRLLLGQYEARDEDLGITLARNSVALWTDDEVAMWTDVGTKGVDWAADLMAALEPVKAEGVAYAANADPARVRAENAEVHVTVFNPAVRENPPSSVFGLYSLSANTRPASKGRQVRAGELFAKSTGADRPRTAILRSASAIADVPGDMFGMGGSVEFLEKFASLDRRPGQ